MKIVRNLSIEGFYHPSVKYHLDFRENIKYTPMPAPVVWVYSCGSGDDIDFYHETCLQLACLVSWPWPACCSDCRIYSQMALNTMLSFWFTLTDQPDTNVNHCDEGTALDVVGNVSDVARKVLAVVLCVVTLTLGVVEDVVEDVATAFGTKVVFFDDFVLCSISDTVLVLMEWWRWLFFNFPWCLSANWPL